jgi:hypothetical protein
MLTSRLARRVLGAAAAVPLALVLLAPAPSSGQGTSKPPDFIPAGYDGYQNMLDQLGIKKVRHAAAGHVALAEACRALDLAKAEVERLYARWQELEARRGPA